MFSFYFINSGEILEHYSLVMMCTHLCMLVQPCIKILFVPPQLVREEWTISAQTPNLVALVECLNDCNCIDIFYIDSCFVGIPT